MNWSPSVRRNRLSEKPNVSLFVNNVSVVENRIESIRDNRESLSDCAFEKETNTKQATNRAIDLFFIDMRIVEKRVQYKHIYERRMD